MTLTPAGIAGADHDGLLAPEPANLTGALIGYARVSTCKRPPSQAAPPRTRRSSAS